MSAEPEPIHVMIAGIGGASLGTELMKCLAAANGYQLFGCDISPTAYGLYDAAFAKTYVVDRNDYISSVVAACRDAGARWLVPGGEQPMVLLAAARDTLDSHGLRLVSNTPEVVKLCSNKAATFRWLTEVGATVPRTAIAADSGSIRSVGIPCVIKPSTGSGGSAMVFFAASLEEAEIYVAYIQRAGGTPIAQEYVDHAQGEFTIGVLSLPDGRLASSIALRRSLDSKLSVLSSGRGGLISTGYTQGYIADFPDIRRQAELIARRIDSRGPINVQARVRDGVLIPFEINPRFSASVYLRALAGCNEPDLLIKYLVTGVIPDPRPVREGWYLRSLAETFVPVGEMKRS